MRSKTLIAAEIGTAHGGSMQKAKELIDAAVDAGADIVKFQWVDAREILHPATGNVPLPGGSTPLYDVFRSLECPPEFYADAAAYVHACGARFMCSPFGIQSMKELIALEPDAIKIASPELNHYPLLKCFSQSMDEREKNGKGAIPLVVSSGVSTLAGIESALEILQAQAAHKSRPLTLLHCVTSYPAPEDEYNLRLISTLRGIFGVDTGISDHSLDPVLVPVLSVCMGAALIEKHITLSHNAGGLDDPVALEPAAFKTMVQAVQQAESQIAHNSGNADYVIQEFKNKFGGEKIDRVLGNGIKRLAVSEQGNYGRTNRSLHYTRALKKGHVITQNDVAVLRTEKILSPGISPAFYEFVQNKRLMRDAMDGAGVLLEDFVDMPQER